MDLLTVDFSEIIPSIIKFIVPGYLFILVYSIICYKEQPDGDHLIIKSVLVSFCLSEILSFILKNKHTERITFISIGCAIVIALFVGVLGNYFLKSPKINSLARMLLIFKTESSTIEDLQDFKYPVKIKLHLNDDSKIYEGVWDKIDNKKDMFVVITRCVISKDNVILADYSNDLTYSMVFKIENIKYMEFIHYSDSTVVTNRG